MRCNNQKQIEEKAENIKYLFKVMGEKSLTIVDIIEESFMSPTTVHRYMKELKKNKRIYVSGWDGNFKKYSIGNLPDVPKTKKVVVKESKVIPKFIPRPDIAAAWMFNKVKL